MPVRITARRIEDLLADQGLTVCDRHVLPGRTPVRCDMPAGLHVAVAARVKELFPNGVYAHQAAAVERVIAGEDVCLATPTASGKSLAFMVAAAHELRSNPTARVIALYPMKALIRDQLAKWKAFLQPLGLVVGFIDGSVPMEARTRIVRESNVLAMTPDVAHAWLMSHLTDTDVARFMSSLALLILDEAHVYDGVFGTNMAYFLRRLAVAARAHRVMCSTATVGEPQESMARLTGRPMGVLGPADDGSAGFEKTLLLAKPGASSSFDGVVRILKGLAAVPGGRFLAFADSRKAVERLAAAAHRDPGAAGDDDSPPVNAASSRILPYRAGYEEEDRRKIQDALADGGLSGVVSTSALELGLDIGEVDVVVLTNSPPSVQAFHQRIGRGGRRGPAVCVVMDDLDVFDSLEEYLRRSPEPGWVYLDNRYIQYSQALCAAAELQSMGIRMVGTGRYPGLPDSFAAHVENELNPAHSVDDDLFALKQQGQGTPHYAFPMRSAGEETFTVAAGPGNKLGTLSYAQLLREAYPGAVYYYMARPYRVVRVEHRKREAFARREAFVTTQPTTQTAVFVDFATGVLAARSAGDDFAAECDVQVSERVVGFTERRGQSRVSHEYGPQSSFSQKPLGRYFRTTGVCFAFPGKVSRSEALARRIMEAFCRVCGVLDRDLGYALFQAPRGPYSAAPVQGMVVYDAVAGSLRLTQRLLDRLPEVVAHAVESSDEDARGELARMSSAVEALSPVKVPGAESTSADVDHVRVVAPGQPAVLVDGPHGATQVTVLAYRYTPQGLVYELASDKPARWIVAARRIQAMPGVTGMLLVDLATGESWPEEGPVAVDRMLTPAPAQNWVSM